MSRVLEWYAPPPFSYVMILILLLLMGKALTTSTRQTSHRPAGRRSLLRISAEGR
jgi:hypothetical protein